MVRVHRSQILKNKQHMCQPRNYAKVPVLLELPGDDQEACSIWCQLIPDTCQFIQTQLTLIASLLYPHDGLRGPQLAHVKIRVQALDSDIPACASGDKAEDGSRRGIVQINTRYFMRQIRRTPTPAETPTPTPTPAPQEQPPVDLNRLRFEMTGVLTHELVHLVQFDGQQTAPSWFIEGLADFMRMQSGQSAKHWKRPHLPKESFEHEGSLVIKESWEGRRGYEAGYSATGYFFQYVERTYPQTILRINADLGEHPWKLDLIKEWTGRSYEELWLAFLLDESSPSST